MSAKTPKPSAKYTKNLDKLAAMLRDRARTVRELAKELKCCKPTIYARIEALRARGDPVFTFTVVDGGETGPRPLAYGISVE